MEDKPFRRTPLGGMDSGDVPSAVIEERHRVAELLRGNGAVDATFVAASMASLSSSPVSQPLSQLPQAPQRMLPKAKAILTYKPPEGVGFSLEFMVNDFEVADLMVTLDLPSDFAFVPDNKMDLTLQVGSHTLDVVFVGGTFKLPRRGINGITFVRKPPSASST